MTNPNFRPETHDFSHDAFTDPAFQESMKNGLLQIHPLNKYYTEDYLNRDMAREKYFAQAVFEATQKAFESGASEVHVLFDIDNTLGSYDSDESGAFKKFSIRPSIFETLKQIENLAERAGKKFDIGLLSNRVLEHTLQQLEKDGQLEPLQQWVNKKYVFSSRRSAKGYDYLTEEEKLAYLANTGVVGIQGEDLKKARYRINPDGVDKLTVLSGLKDHLAEGERIVVIDDSPMYPEILDETKGFSGVCMQEKGYFSSH
jgi:hypothetical protein